MWGMAKVNENETGHPGGLRPTQFTPGGNRYEVDPLELNMELQFPSSITVYDTLRSQDGQVGSVLTAIVLAITGARWDLDTEGVRPEVVDLVRSELGLPAPGEALARHRRHGINWLEHVEQAVETSLWAGFAPFEQVYEVGDPTPEQEAAGLGKIIHLRKLAPRPPRTITEIEVARDGGLKNIHQSSLKFGEDVVIPVDRLVFYAHKKEGADWTGRSVLRQAYKHWLIKDVFIRLDAQAAERNSMGIPVVYYQDDSQKDLAFETATNLRAGATAGIALPTTCRLEIVGVSGSTVDLTPRINYHDQQIARSALAMFLDLGHDSGARSLGETFHGVFLDSVQALAGKIAGIATEHIVRDLVELNFGPGTAYPALNPGDLKANEGIDTTALKELVDAGVIRPDDQLEATQRTRFGLPEADPSSARDPKPATGQPVAVPATAATAGEASSHEDDLSDLLQQVIETRQRATARKASNVS